MDDGREQREQRNWTASGERRGTVDRAGDLSRSGVTGPRHARVGEAQSAPGRRRARLRKDARPPGDPSPPSEPVAPATKELIVHAAADAFAGCGFAGGASIGEIAAAADVSVPDVYSHFRGKAELFRAVVTSTLDSVDPLLRCGAAPTPAALHEWMDWLMSPPQLRLRALIAEINHAGVRDPEVRALLLAYGTQYGAMIAGERGAAQYAPWTLTLRPMRPLS